MTARATLRLTWQPVGNVDFVSESVPLLVLKQCFSHSLQALLGYERWHTEGFNGLAAVQSPRFALARTAASLSFAPGMIRTAFSK